MYVLCFPVVRVHLKKKKTNFKIILKNVSHLAISSQAARRGCAVERLELATSREGTVWKEVSPCTRGGIQVSHDRIVG